MGHQLAVIFPFEKNRHRVDEQAKEYLIEVYPEKDIILFIGDINSINNLKTKFIGGVTA